MRLFCLFLLVSTIASCRTLPVTEIRVAKGATFDLQSPASLGQAISLEQIVEAKYGDKEFSFHCLLEVDAKQLTLVGMTPMNTRAFTLTFDGEMLSVEMMPGAKMPAPPERILADLQLALWPDPIVRGLEFSEAGDDCGWGCQFRHLTRGKTPVIDITYGPSTHESPWSGDILFQHVEQDYSLRVKTVRAEKLEP